MKKNNNVKIYSPIIQEAYNSIPELDFATDAIADGIAARIDAVMKNKGISKKELAALTHRRPSDVTRWLGGTHNFTLRTLALISTALGEDIITIVNQYGIVEENCPMAAEEQK